MSNEERKRLLADHRKLVAGLFKIDEAGHTEDFLKRLVLNKSMRSGNLVDVSVILKLCAWYREIAPRALPNGEVLDITRVEIEEHWGKPMDWNWFCGLDKK